MQKEFLIFFFLLGELFGAEVHHLYELDLVGIGKWRINSLAVYKFTPFGHQLHTLIAQKVIDEGFAGVDVRRLLVQRDVMAVPHHFTQSNIIERRAFFSEDISILHVRNRDRRLTRVDSQ